MKLLIFDTESTGMINFPAPSEGDDQPHVVQIAGILCDSDTGAVEEEFCVLVKPEGWVSDEEAFKVHGITTERAMEYGISELDALQLFLDFYDKCDLRVAHGTNFDNRMIRIMLKRYMPDLIPDNVWKDKSAYYCTLMNAKKIMGGKSGHTLTEAYLHFTGKTLVGAHDAMVDSRACMEIYFAINQPDKFQK